MGTCRAPERREIQIGEVEGLSGGNSSVHSSIKSGAYTGRLANHNLAGMNNSSPNLTNVYLDKPLVVPKLEPLEYVPLPGCLGQPSKYPPTSTGAYIGGFRRRPPPPPPPYHTRTWMHPPTGRAQQCRVMQTSTGKEKNWEFGHKWGTPVKNLDTGFGEAYPPPPPTSMSTGGGQGID